MEEIREIEPFDTTWLYRASIDDGAPEWLLVGAAKEIDRLRAELAQFEGLPVYGRDVVPLGGSGWVKMRNGGRAVVPPYDDDWLIS